MENKKKRPRVAFSLKGEIVTGWLVKEDSKNVWVQINKNPDSIIKRHKKKHRVKVMRASL